MNNIEIRNILKEVSEKTYACEFTDDENKENMLVVSHTLVRGGAPLVLLELLRMLKKQFNIIMISLTDGDLWEEFNSEEIEVYVASYDHYFDLNDDFWDCFDKVILNTLLCYSVLPFFQNRKNRVVWWLHEPEVLFGSVTGRMIPMRQLSKNIIPLSVTADTASFAKKYFDYDSEIMHMGIIDRYAPETEEKHEKVTFFMPAAFQPIKGQDIAVNAILQLPDDYRNRACFVFAGMFDASYPEWYQLVEKVAQALPDSVKMLGRLSQNDVYDWYTKTDCVWAPSRADATPTTIVEGMMFRKLCIVSDAAGISKYMTDGQNGFIFKSEDVEELVEVLKEVIDNYSGMEEIRDEGRKIYLSSFEQGVVYKQLLSILNR